MFNRIKIGWSNGLKKPSDEYDYNYRHGYYMHPQVLHNKIIKMLDEKFPANYEGFIDDKLFYGMCNTAKNEKLYKLSKKERDIEEIKDAWDYIVNLRVNMSISEMILYFNNYEGQSFEHYYIYECFMMELLSRNRNVDLLLSETMTNSVLSIFSNKLHLDEIDVRREMHYWLKTYSEKYDGKKSIDVIDSYSVSNKVLTILFNQKQNINDTVGYPFI
jgi:hypothetical protein